MVSRFRVGVISSTHGIRGEVKVFPTTDDASRFLALKQVILEAKRETRELEIEHVKFFKQFVILKFKGIDDINDVEKYKGAELWVTRENAVPLQEGEYFIADLIGLPVVTDEGGTLGVLKDVLQTGANDVYEVTMENGKELLLPVIDECVLNVNLEKGEILVHVMDGLLDL
ncbi:ribosome maturation factor RimM [Qiania dongpingensis]|uniref:Ribosome maturation factor RimM n=1 Tax=Qiania dongpingensis TaxID=2763669 RepID=A0A7G9G553_9FIRM|nr:ribosome maturation factor RimM [Qiania dongpingensis]QNM05935.1 16S rRNA processing protein RimM [Qiania dongpingensis]